MRTRLLAAVLVTLLPGCSPDLLAEGEAISRAAQPIVNGTPTSGDPAVVYIDVGCSGTLVTSRIVLTACHCLEGVSGHPEVFFGSDVSGAGSWIQTSHHAVYPGACVGDGDLAMLTLTQDGPAAPIPIGDRDLGQHLGEPVRVAGFGVTGEYSGGSGIKREGTTVLGDLDPGVMYCDPTIQSGTCYGDSGGPNFMVFDGTEHVVGTTSYGTQACGSGWDASARTDAHYDWLSQYIQDQDPADCGADGNCASFCSAPDPDCPCAADGFCSDACPDPSADPDCPGCGPDGTCRQDCPDLDLDCCAFDGQCAPDCGELDPDCGGEGTGGDPSTSSSSSSGTASSSSSSGHDRTQTGETDELGDGGLVGSVACSSSPARAGSASDPLWLGILLAALWRRRQRTTP